MYVVFVLLLVAVHAVHRRRPHHAAEYLAGAVDYAVSGVAGGFTPLVRARAHAELARAGGEGFGADETAALACLTAELHGLRHFVGRP
jgi:hypothetical protein